MIFNILILQFQYSIQNIGVFERQFLSNPPQTDERTNMIEVKKYHNTQMDVLFNKAGPYIIS